MSYLSFDKENFYLNGERFRIYSGAVHYFRIVPKYWKDRLYKLKQCGFNTVETVIPWSLHEPREGEYNFSGICDIEKYIGLASELGLYVILRPGPYICAEFDMGGLPYWLLKNEGMRFRCMHEGFLEKVESYYKVLLSKLKPHLIENGGNIIAMQIENEYGSFGDDKEYIKRIEKIFTDNDINCLLFTSDGPGYFMLSGGTCDGRLATVNFGSNPKDNFALLQKFRDDQPSMCMEYWNGWFDHWYEEHHVRGAGETAEVLKEMLDGGHSVNLYMFHGGTNFGFYNGANYDEHLQPTVTSYDYNCPVSECGDLTDKYMEIRAVMEKHLGKELPIVCGNSKKKAYGEVSLGKRADLFENKEVLSKCVKAAYPMTFEELDLGRGYVLYESEFEGPFENLELEIDGVKDRAEIFIDDKLLGIKEDTGKRWDKVFVPALSFNEKFNMKILLENMGRVNYGGHISDHKGILGGVRIANRYHFGWKMYPMDFEDISGLRYDDIEEKAASGGDREKAFERPGFYKGTLTVDECCDTFVRLLGFTKGSVWINGFNIGRFFNPAGPQKTLYVPAPLLKEGENEVVVFESDKVTNPVISFEDLEEL